MCQLPLVSEKKIKMLKTTFVITQIGSITGGTTITFCELPTYYKHVQNSRVKFGASAGSCATNMWQNWFALKCGKYKRWLFFPNLTIFQSSTKMPVGGVSS